MRSVTASIGALLVVFATGFLPFASPAADEDVGLTSLNVLRHQYPQAFFFRSAESFAANPRVSYEQWDATFERLMGIEGKVLEEEVPGRSVRNIDFFTRFKHRHSDQLVLLHYNGNARDPRDEHEKFFAGHWVYYNGARIQQDLPAQAGEVDIHVDRPELFRMNIGRYRNTNEDIGLCRLDEKGCPDWSYSEQVQLISVDGRAKSIRVRRGCYGTNPLAFQADRACAAAHVTEGPWGRRSHLLWFYNYSTRCPRDALGRRCADILAEELGRRFGPHGALAAFDGLEFDVLHHQCHGAAGGRGPDCDADGKRDNGFFDGINTYGNGVVGFCKLVRKQLGNDRLILADGMSLGNQRAFGILNGIESEGWPTLSDWQIRDWSGGLNRHFFWSQNAHPPVFNYINHKYVAHGPMPGVTRRPDVPFSTHRLVFAAAVMTDSAVCYSFTPPPEPGEVIGVWDELQMGREHRPGWLGRALGPARRLAQEQPDLLGSQGVPNAASLTERFSGPAVQFAADGGLKVSSSDPEAKELRFRFSNVATRGTDLLVTMRAHGQPRTGYAPEMARLTWVGIAPPEGQFVRASLPASGMCLRGRPETELIPGSGASVRFVKKCRLGDEQRDAYQTHPPYGNATVNTFWQRDVVAPEGATLSLRTGMGPKSPERSDGVTFTVQVATVEAGRVGHFTRVFEHSQVESLWMSHQVSLAAWAGKTIRLKFIADCGPNDNATTDHAYWADVWVVGPGGRQSVTPSQRSMTWINDRDFESGFYFSDIQSTTVDLEFVVEGAEPVWLLRLAAYGSVDAMVREFEHGVVLVNPGPKPLELDLDRLFPGQPLRRISGSSQQDCDTNNGLPISGRIQLGPRDGLFLIKD